MNRIIRLSGLCLCLMLGACTPMAEGLQDGSQTIGEAKDDISVTMRNLFTYNPRPRTPQPSSTRYCYRFASDIVCYDTPQPQITSPLVGVQGAEGARVITHAAPYQPRTAYVTPAYSQPMPGAPLDISGPVASSGPGSQIQSQNLPPIAR